jgi:TonB-dependent starch-binding outer membrane protein SusC
MRTIFFILFIAISQTFAIGSYSQTVRLSLNLKNVTIKDALQEIENKSEFYFMYDATKVNVDQKVKENIVSNNMLVTEIFDKLFSGTGITYKINNRLVALSNSQNSSGKIISKITGKVTDASGAPLPGVSVVIKGTTSGTITDANGNYSLSNIPDNTVLQFSFVGMKSLEIPVSGKNTINALLTEDTVGLEEVVAVGYGTIKKGDLTGSVAAIAPKELENRPLTNVSNALSGIATGISVTSANNRPGDDNATILIRGKGTLNDATPLVVIDGMEGDINSVNVQDIESLSILKDASSAAIYGSRAANGVILITTKSGKSGAIKLDYTGYMTSQSIRPNILQPVSNYADYMELINEGYTNSSQLAIFSDTSIEIWRNDAGKNPLSYPNTNYIESMFKNSIGTNQVLSISGGTDKMNFYGSLGYFDNPGVLENAGYQRYSMRASINATIKPWIKIGLNLNGFMGSADPGNAGNSEDSSDLGVFTWAGATTPAMIYKHNGLYGGIQNSEDDISESSNNPLMVLNSVKGDNITHYGKANLYATITPLKGLSITGSFSYDLKDKQTKTMPVFHDTWNFRTNTIITSGTGTSYVSQYDYKTRRNYMDLVSHYNTQFFTNRLDFKVMLGASQEKYQYDWFKAYRQDLTSTELSVLDAATGSTSVGGNLSDWTMRSYFGRINLEWENKYLAELNLRSDGSSRFQGNNRWGYFPSGSIGWRVSQENFLKYCKWLSNLKVRASYGSLGNNSVGNYASISSYSFANYVLNNGVATGLAITALANGNLTWEKTKVADLGVDFGFFNNKLNGTIDYYDKITSGILVSLPAPAVHGLAGVPTQNSAKVSNKGFEISLGWRSKIHDITYSVTGNYTYNVNNVDKFKGSEYSLDGINMIKEGLPINSIYGLVVDRIVQTDEDLEYVQNMIDNAPTQSGTKVNPFQTYGTPQKGDILYKDTNNDGIINSDDREVIGNPNPKHFFGLNMSVGYKGFDLSVFMQGVAGIDGYLNESYFTTSVKRGYQISKEIADHCWRDGSTDAKYPRLTTSSSLNTQYSNLWLQNKGYLKIRNVQFGYSLQKPALNKLMIDKLRIWVSLENFFTFTKYKGLDPELSNNLSYPTMRQAVLGINIGL